MHMAFSMKVTPEIEELTNICLDNSKMDVSLYGQYDVKRGLRDINGVGVLAGLTQISNVVSSDIINGGPAHLPRHQRGKTDPGLFK